MTLSLVEVTKIGFLNTSFSFLFTRIGFFVFMCLTNSTIPPSYLWVYSFVFFKVLSTKFIAIPLFKKASSLILFSSIDALNLVDENISFEGKKLILVPFFFVLPIFFKGLSEFPSLNLTSF